MKFFEEENNLDMQVGQYFNRWIESKSDSRQKSIREFMKRYKSMKPRTARKLLAIYITQCGNLE